MKKLFPALVLFGFLSACNNSVKDETKSEEPTTTTPTTTTPATTPTTTKVSPNTDAAPLVPDPGTAKTDANTTTVSIPGFSDPEIQKFVNDYTAFVMSYKKGIIDPSKAQQLAKDAQVWQSKWPTYTQKLASNPAELKKWRDWGEAMRKEMMVKAN